MSDQEAMSIVGNYIKAALDDVGGTRTIELKNGECHLLTLTWNEGYNLATLTIKCTTDDLAKITR